MEGIDKVHIHAILAKLLLNECFIIHCDPFAAIHKMLVCLTALVLFLLLAAVLG